MPLDTIVSEDEPETPPSTPPVMVDSITGNDRVAFNPDSRVPRLNSPEGVTTASLVLPTSNF